MSEEKQKYLTHSLKWGAICGVLLVVPMMISNLAMGREGVALVGFLPYFAISTCIYLCQRAMVRDDNTWTFGGLLALGLICGVSASLFVDLYCAVYIKMVDPGFMEKSLSDAQKLLESMGTYPQDQIEQSMEVSRKLFVGITMITNTIIYTIISLLFAALGAFLNRRGNRTN